MTAQQIISRRIIALVASGMDVREALDTVCGAGVFDKLAGDVCRELRAKAGL